MGCDIHSFVELKTEDGWFMVPGLFPQNSFGRKWDGTTHQNEPFEGRNYGVFGFLANVRNYSLIPPLSEPRGLPDGISKPIKESYEKWDGDGHSHSWLTLKELSDFDYSATFEDRRCTKQVGPNSFNGASDSGDGNGKLVTFREFLGDTFMRDIEIMKGVGNPESVRIVFWFDN
jgi:hypothetical protein